MTFLIDEIDSDDFAAVVVLNEALDVTSKQSRHLIQF